ncbi:Copia protein [Termitomyces sp. J132]|nr:Copia protein [Termitomyces sp. J132]
MAAFESTQECIWLCTLLKGIGYNVIAKPTPILCDNNAAIKLLEDPTLHSQVKHVDIKYHFLCECAQSNKISIHYINTKYNIANLFTKALPGPQFCRLRSLLRLK